jgi:integrase
LFGHRAEVRVPPKDRHPQDSEALGARPFGHLYRPTYRDRKTGERREGSFWWLKFNDQHGKTRYENTKCRDKRKANDIRKLRCAEVWAGLLPKKKRDTTVGEVLSHWVIHFKLKGRRSIDKAELHAKRLGEYFGLEAPSASVTEARVAEFILDRKRAEFSNATINRHLAALRGAYRRASRSVNEDGDPMVVRVPVIELLEEAPPRSGFFEEWELEKVLVNLRPHVRSVVEFLYLTGYRMREVLGLTWDRVDWEAGVIQLAPGTTKGKSGRDPFPFRADRRLELVMERQRAALEHLATPTRWVFFHGAGEPVRSFRTAWLQACEKAGVERLVHDLRRTAVRNLVLAGVDERRAMRLTGHKTRAVFDRYNIVDPNDLVESVERASRAREARARNQMVLPFARKG